MDNPQQASNNCAAAETEREDILLRDGATVRAPNII